MVVTPTIVIANYTGLSDVDVTSGLGTLRTRLAAITTPVTVASAYITVSNGWVYEPAGRTNWPTQWGLVLLDRDAVWSDPRPNPVGYFDPRVSTFAHNPLAKVFLDETDDWVEASAQAIKTMVDSFGLPSTPLLPQSSRLVSKPYRILSLAVGYPVVGVGFVLASVGQGIHAFGVRLTKVGFRLLSAGGAVIEQPNPPQGWGP